MNASLVSEAAPDRKMWWCASHGTTPAGRRIAVSAEDLPAERDCLWGVEDGLSPEAARVGAYLAAQALMGEAIAPIGELAEECEIAPERALLALDELQAAHVITSWADTAGIICAWFDIDADLYYGDDTTPLPEDDSDCDDYYYPDCEEDFPAEDPCPKRHRIFLKTKYRCFYCSVAPAKAIDHMHPSVRGGSDEDENLIGACTSCNSQKKDKTVEEYRAWLAYKRRCPDISHVRFWGEAVN